jgi:hypothetical protein
VSGDAAPFVGPRASSASSCARDSATIIDDISDFERTDDFRSIPVPRRESNGATPNLQCGLFVVVV